LDDDNYDDDEDGDDDDDDDDDVDDDDDDNDDEHNSEFPSLVAIYFQTLNIYLHLSKRHNTLRTAEQLQ
jgi:hypothetical protein